MNKTVAMIISGLIRFLAFVGFLIFAFGKDIPGMMGLGTYLVLIELSDIKTLIKERK